MQRTIGMLVALASLSAAYAQSPDAVRAESAPAPSTSQPAPIVRANPGSYPAYRAPQLFDLQPAAGISVRSDVDQGVQTVSTSEARTELRVLRGRADIMLHHPKDHSEIVVDLPAGRVSLLKDGVYTFNAETNTVRVLKGEAEAMPGTPNDGKGTKVKEEQQLTLSSTGRLKSVEAYPYELTADLLRGDGPDGDGNPALAYGPYGGEGFYAGYPYYPAGYGYPWGGFAPYGYGYGYPVGVGIGFGYFGGFRGHGFRR